MPVVFWEQSYMLLSVSLTCSESDLISIYCISASLPASVVLYPESQHYKAFETVCEILLIYNENKKKIIKKNNKKIKNMEAFDINAI